MVNWHTFKLLNHHFLFDVPSNSLFGINQAAYNYLNRLPLPPTEVAGVEADLAELRAQGYLSETKEQQPKYQRQPLLKALCLHVAHDCNLRCQYCFAGRGAFGGPRQRMSFQVGQQAIDLLLRESGARRELEVDFFGGEPLLNLRVVQALVTYGREAASRYNKKLHFTLTTNGLLLDSATRHFLNEAQIAVVLSLDGRPGVNDRLRGAGSYQRVLPLIKALVAERNATNYYLRGTYSSYNLDFAEDVKHLYQMGFREISLEPVVSPEGNYRLHLEQLDQLEAEYERLAEFYWQKRQAGAGFTFFHFEIDLEHGPCLLKRLTGCGAGFDYLAVTPTGELYPCHQFVGRDEFIMGDVARGITRPELRHEFGAATLYQKKGCAECWARFYCSGGCHANAHSLNGSIYQPDELSCRLQRKRLECALALKGLEQLEGPGRPGL